jgi:hypothetical protein
MRGGIGSDCTDRTIDLTTKPRFDGVRIPYNFAIGTRRDSGNLDATNLPACLDALKTAGVGVVAMKGDGGRLQRPAGERSALRRVPARSGSRTASRFAGGSCERGNWSPDDPVLNSSK